MDGTKTNTQRRHNVAISVHKVKRHEGVSQSVCQSVSLSVIVEK